MIKQEQSIKRRMKIKMGAIIVLLFILAVSAVFTLTGLSFVQLAMAISSNYSKITGSQLTVADWNNLPNDFVARTGGAASAMQGALDMANNRINNLASPTNNSDASTKQYVDTAVTGAGGGGVYVNWGQENCPSGTTELYSGFAFHQYYSHTGGGNPICIQSGDPSPAASVGLNSDNLYPMTTATAGQLPPGIPAAKYVKCAVCSYGGTCFERWGRQDCAGAAGFNPIYTGYGLGSYANRATGATNRYCVDNSSNFDGSISATFLDSSFYGTSIYNNGSIGLYTTDSYVKCAMCCN